MSVERLVLEIGSAEIVMVELPAGSALVGCRRPTFEGGEHQFIAKLTCGFWIQDSPVTVAQWSALAETPIDARASESCVKLGVSWFEAMDWLAHLNRVASGNVPDGFEFTLPTEIEWEYALRARTHSRYGYCEKAGELQNFAQCGEERRSIPVKALRPNVWGLHDFLGCGLQWCRDTPWGYPQGCPTVSDPCGREPSDLRVARGSLPREAAQDIGPGQRLFLPAISSGHSGLRAALVARSRL